MLPLRLTPFVHRTTATRRHRPARCDRGPLGVPIMAIRYVNSRLRRIPPYSAGAALFFQANASVRPCYAVTGHPYATKDAKLTKNTRPYRQPMPLRGADPIYSVPQ